jgi:hypothetical protein
MVARGCAIGILAGLLVVAFESDITGKICEYNQATKHEDCTTYSLFPFLLIQIFNTLNYYGVAITALATIVIAGFTGTLWHSTKLNAEAFMNSESAQLWMDEVKIHGIRTTPTALKLSYVIRNFGNSHGWVHHKPTMIVMGESLPEERSLDQTANPETSVVPARHSTDGKADIPKVIAQHLINALLAPNPTTFMFVYGSINYRDVFRGERRAGFAYKIVFGGGDISESSIIAGGPAYWDYQ